MCGIIGYVGERGASDLILDGLRRLEYRGYDSAGIATLSGGQFHVLKREGRLDALAQALDAQPLPGTVGIGHTRWATHGEPTEANAHPHLGEKSRVAIVHNGIIENHAQLRRQLMHEGVRFASDTDSEVIAQLAERLYQGDLVQMVLGLARQLEGAYALGILCLDEPDTLLAVKRDSPLIVGLNQHGNFIASDVSAVLMHTRRVVDLSDGEIAVLTKRGARFYDEFGEPIDKPERIIDWDQQAAERAGYPHFMFKEMMEQPRAIEDTLRSAEAGGSNHGVLQSLDLTAYRRVEIIGCGSAYNAGMVGKYLIESKMAVPVEVDLSSEFRYRDPLVDEHTLVILISQSGETADTIAALREARRKRAHTLGIVNVLGSTIAREADQVLYTRAGPEIAVATTKAFSAQLAMLLLIAGLGEQAKQLPGLVSQVLARVDALQQFAASCRSAKSIFFIGRGIDSAISLEGSLKLKEISYVHSEAYAGGELKHGPISLIEEGTWVVASCGNRQLLTKTMSNVQQVLSRGARVLLITPFEDIAPDARTMVMPIPACDALLSPSLSVVAMQLLSYYVALGKGLDIDKPRNLAKSVTVE